MSGIKDRERSSLEGAQRALPSTPTREDANFTASRLLLARERRGLTRKELAAQIGVTPDCVTKYEAQSCSPSNDTLHRCSFALGFPIGWFTAPEVSLLDSDALSFRARRSMSAALRSKATRAGDMAISVVLPELRRRFALPPVAVPDLSQHEPEEAAALLRHEWKLGCGPISNMVHLLEAKGVGVFWLNEDSACLDAWSLWHDEMPVVMFNIRGVAGCRARFDAAHELGHLVLHRGADVLDGLEVENQANRFASAFLLPEDQFRAESPRYPILDAFFPLKKRWGVSLAAMVMRSKQLGIFSDWNTRRAFQEIATRGWKTREPDEIALPRESSRLQAMIGERLRAKKIGEAQFAQDLFLVKSDLLELMPFLPAPAAIATAAKAEKPARPRRASAPKKATRKTAEKKKPVLSLVARSDGETEEYGEEEIAPMPSLRLVS